jgi:hypothetical protein
LGATTFVITTLSIMNLVIKEGGSLYNIVPNVAMEWHNLKNVNNGRESTVNRALDGNIYPG